MMIFIFGSAKESEILATLQQEWRSSLKTFGSLQQMYCETQQML